MTGNVSSLEATMAGRPQPAAGRGWVLCACLFWLGLVLAATSGTTAERSVTPNVLKGQAANCGLFVGVNEFETNAALPNLRFAVDDAVALAHMFGLQLNRIPPARLRLCLGGTPASEAGMRKLQALRQAGARVVGATQNDIADELVSLSEARGDAGTLVVVAFSTHGIEADGEPCLLPADYRPKRASEKLIRLSQVQDCLNQMPAGEKVLIVDACRQQPVTTQRGTGGMSRAWERDRRGGRGVVVTGPPANRGRGFIEFRSCSVGQVSHENDVLKQGVFTHFLLLGLAGRAATDDEGYVCMKPLVDYVKQSTEDWAQSELNLEQTPSYSGEHNWEDIRLAFRRTGVAADRFEQRGSGWTNSLGMSFVPIFQDAARGQRLLFSRCETRVRDFEAFVRGAGATHLTLWRKTGFPQTSEDPVVRVSLAEAQSFCEWLTRKERDEQRLEEQESYRLPTPQEWEDAALAGVETPPLAARDPFVWGPVWPPPNVSGNYGGAERTTSSSPLQTIPGFRDRHVYTAPAGSYPANRAGLCDLAGNVWEWCAGGSGKTAVAGARGGAYNTTERDKLRASFLYGIPPGVHQEDVGFRCVLDVGDYHHDGPSPKPDL